MNIFSRNKKVNNEIEKVVSKEDLLKRINNNRDEIERWLNGDYPLDIVYAQIKYLSDKNESLITEIKQIK
jgi:hypothetical protein